MHQRCIAWMVDAVFRLLKGKGELLTVNESVLVPVKIAVACDQWIKRPHACRNVPRGEEEFNTVEHPIAIGINVVRVGGVARHVGLVLAQEITKRFGGWNSRPLLECKGCADGGNEPLRRRAIGVCFGEQGGNDVVFFPVGHAVVVCVLPAVRRVQRIERPCIIEEVPTSVPNFPAIGHTVIIGVSI